MESIYCGVPQGSILGPLLFLWLEKNELLINTKKGKTEAMVFGTAEQSFSTARRLKSWLRVFMTAKRFNAVAILNSNKDLTDELDLMEIGNKFISKNHERFRQFGKFSKEDFCQVLGLCLL